MQQTTFHIARMDCPSEEQMIRLKLSDLAGIHSLDFDLSKRTLSVVHSGDPRAILTRLESLGLGATLAGSGPARESSIHDASASQRRVLWQVLAINLAFFGLEMLAGFLARSMGLVADSLDMLADAMVYGLSLMAVGRPAVHKHRVAAVSGYLQMVLALGGLTEVIRRFSGAGSMPSFDTMIVVSALALAGNVACLYLLRKDRSGEAHMKASMIFTSNDVVVNLGVIIAGVLVFVTHSRYPDLIAGLIIFAIVVRGAFRILKLSRPPAPQSFRQRTLKP